MKTLWLVREPCTVLFDVKPIHEALETEKMDSSVEVVLTDKEYQEFQQVCSQFKKWQEILDLLFEQK